MVTKVEVIPSLEVAYGGINRLILRHRGRISIPRYEGSFVKMGGNFRKLQNSVRGQSMGVQFGRLFI